MSHVLVPYLSTVTVFSTRHVAVTKGHVTVCRIDMPTSICRVKDREPLRGHLRQRGRGPGALDS